MAKFADGSGLNPDGVAAFTAALDAAAAAAEVFEAAAAELGADIDSELATLHRTDTGNAERLVRRADGLIRHCHPWGKWLHYDGRRWAVDQTGAVRRLAVQTARKILCESATLEDNETRKRLADWSFASESRDKLSAMIQEAASWEGVPILPADLDADPWLLNVENGTIDLKTGELRPHRREDFVTGLAPVHFDPAAQCPLWESTLARFLVTHELIRFVQQLFGMALTGDVSAQILPIFHGGGDNGKSTILGAILGMLGTDHASIAPANFITLGQDRHPTELANLHGKRLVVVMEWPEGRRLNESLIKQLTGNDAITARRMREDFWTFQPTHRLLLCANTKPVIKGTDHAIWRRPKLVPFNVQIPAAEKIHDFPARLKAEYPGILRWAVAGCLDWRENGLAVPAEVADATKQYRAEQDDIGAFIAECCELNPVFDVAARDLYRGYTEFAEGSGEVVLSPKRFGMAMTARGCERYTNNGARYRGIRLRRTTPAWMP